METPSAADPPDDEDVSQLDRRVSKAVEEEHAFLEYIASLPAMSSENVEAFKKKESPDLGAHESVGGLETLDNLYKLMEHLGRLRRQNSKLQKRLQYLENADPDCEESTTRSRRFSSKTKTLTRTISKDDATTNVVSTTVKSKVSKWTKVKEAFRWEKASGGVLLPEAASQDSGLGGGDFHLRPPGDRSSYSVSPADSVLSGPPPRLASSLSTSEDELELDLSDCGQKRRTLSLEKNVHLGVEEDETRRSKSLDGESIESAQGINDQPTSHSKENRFSHNSQKVHKTPWSKVKDIIQTRTGSIKKKKGTDNTDADEECPVDALEGEERDYEYKSFDFVLSEDAMDPSSEVSQRMTNMSNRNKRLAPVLTITLPSTEELRPPDSKAGVSPTPSNKNGKPPPSPQVEEKHNKTLMRQKTMEELPSKDQYKKQVSSSSAGTSPPTPRRKSKWSKVKNAFLTSTPSPEDIAAHFSNSTPSSPVNKCSFLYDLESDELSSSEFIDENLQENNDNVFIEPADDNFNTRSQQMTAQKNLEELHLRFSNEFHQKLSEWERIRNSGIGISSPPSAGKVSASGLSSGTSSVGEEEKRDKRRSEEWDRMKSGRKRESLALQQLGEENLSPDFKKKLEQWERIKAIPVSPTQESSPVLQLQSKKKITDWQRWRPGSSSTKTDNHSHNFPHELPEEFSKRLQDWDRMKHGTSVEVSDASQKPANRTPSPGVSHDVVFEHKSRKIQHRLSETKDKWADTGHKVLKSKSHHEMKELAWLEKELHKIEREKQRLERERDKYLEREARLQKMRRAIGSTQQKQEVVIPTSTGVFRFEGISQKFTKKLYEWEKARGIGPEASTIALLDPGYKPQSGNSISGETLKKNGALLLRSKSMGSVVDIAGGGGCQASVITHQPSSLSLNNMEEIGNTQIIGQDPDSCLSDKEDDYDDYYDGDEPGAVIVDIEDVVEETASPLAEPPAVLTEIPVYCYAPAEVTRLIDSSGSENELSSENVQSSYCILQENIDLLDELKKKEDICRRIEIQMENIEEKIQSTANVRERKLESLSMDEPQMDKLECDPGEDEVTELHDIKSQLKILDDDQEALKQEEETLQYSFAEHSEQQAVLAQSLVDNMRQLQEVNNCMAAKDTPDSPKRSSNDPQEEALAKVQDLTGQLLTMAERLEVIVGERNKELSRLRESISPHNTRRPYLSKHSLSTDSITMSPTTSSVSRLPRQSSEELSQLPTMLTSKVLELKRGLTYLCAVSDAAVKAVSRTCNINDDKPKRKLETDVEPTTISELCQESDGAGAVSIEKMTSHDKDESESELKSNYENNLIVGCLTLPALIFRKDGSKLEFGLENEMIKPTSRAINESEIREMEQEDEKSNSDCGASKSQVTTTEIVSENIDEIGQETKKVRKVKLERQSSKDNGRRTRFAKCTKDGSETAVSNNIRSRRLKRETNSESSLKYEEGKDKKSSTNSGVQSEDVLGAEALKLHITEPTGEVATRQEDRKVDLEASLVTETTSQCSTDVNRRSQIVAATGTSDPVDVFVPTTRKIFSPVRRDSKGKASSVISYIVRENPPPDQVPLSPRRVRRRNEQEEKTKLQNKNVEEDDENRRDNFVLPPCWILRETRAQSASPALQRRNFPVPRSREKQTESDLTPNTRKNVEFKIEDGDHISSQNTPVTDDSLVPKPGENSRVQENKFGNYGTPTSPTPPTPPLAKKYSVPNRENLPSESTDRNSSEMKPQPIRKSRTEIGFPPISPIPGRREVKLSKETAPSIRMIIARYNQKVSESQEMLGSKSPDSGSGSPLPWRSPGAERRVRVQMEKYQDEVRRALQGSEGRKHNFSGEVKKSASASFIRSFDKGSVQDRFGRRPSDSLSERQTSEMRYNGILKSSSAGSIKPGTPVPQRREAATLEKLETTTNIPPSQSTVPPALDPPSPENRVLDEDISTTVTPTVIPTSETKCIEEKISKVCSVERTGSRALRIKKAKEEFLSRGPGGTWSTNANVKTDSSNMPSTSEEGWSQTKNRLSRVSCESEASCEGILVSGEEHRQPFDSRLLVKSASAGMINIDSLSFGSILPESTSNSSVPSGSSEQGAGSSKSRFALSNIASRFRKVKMRRHKEKERDKMETVSTLCRQSLLVDIQKRKAADKRDKVSSKSCPSSPVLQKRESNSSWSISPRRIFKPK